MKVTFILHIGFLVLLTTPAWSQADSNAVKTDEIIEEIIESKPVSAEKVEYLSQVTKYGFKNLFRNYTYNPEIPYDQQVNPYAESYMQSYLNSHTGYLQRLQKNATPYFNLIDGILSQYGLPHELKYLAVIESELKSTALSHAGARGPWQFMDYTARGFGLRVDQEVDERVDYQKSTHAAARYLLQLYRDMKDWLLVIAAYNGGPGRVHSAIKKSGSRSFWKLQYYLPEESRNHVKKFIATHFVMENGNSGFGVMYGGNGDAQIPDSLNVNLTTLTISGKYDAAVTAGILDMPLSVFNTLNPQMNHVLAAGDDFELKLPAEKMDQFKQKRLEILNKSVDAMLSGAILESKTLYDKDRRRM